MPEPLEGHSLVYYHQSLQPGPWRACPSREGLFLVNRATDVRVPAACLRLNCVVCVRICAHRYARAIGLARPHNHILLTQVGDDWATVRNRVNAFRRIIRRGGRRWEDMFHVERNPRSTGRHVHAWQWGDPVSLSEVTEAAVRSGMGSFVDVQSRIRPEGEPLGYGMKTVLSGSVDVQTIPTATAEFLEINGGRLGHATQGFWRDHQGDPLSGIRAAVKAASRHAAEGEWVLVREASRTRHEVS